MLVMSFSVVVDAARLEDVLERFGSKDPFERELAAADLRETKPEEVAELADAVQSADRERRFRAATILSEIVQALLEQYEREQRALDLDAEALSRLHGRQNAAAAREELARRLTDMSATHPDTGDHLKTRLELLNLQRYERTEGVVLTDEERTKWAKLEEAWKELVEDDPELPERLRVLVDLSGRVGSDGRPLTQVEELHLGELTERTKERRERVERLRGELDALGPLALNEALSRARTSRAEMRTVLERYVATSIGDTVDHLEVGQAFTVARYFRGMLWAWEAERDSAHAQAAKDLLERHLEDTIKDLSDVLPEVRRRAAAELYALGQQGRARLATLHAAEPRADHEFLLHLLQWRIHPATYERTGVHFLDFAGRSFRDRRRTVFEYARVAGKSAVPTLRAIVEDEELETSFLIKLAAAKALAGLRDLSGYNVLVRDHPEMTLKKPAVSREILILQGYEYIREKQYRLAVEELRRVLDEFPFDFRANYHIAFAYLLLKDYTRSIHHFEVARRIHPKDQLTLYNLACAYSLHGDTDAAVKTLIESVDAGFTDVDHIEKDPDLDPLRDHEDYLGLIARLKKSE